MKDREQAALDELKTGTEKITMGRTQKNEKETEERNRNKKSNGKRIWI